MYFKSLDKKECSGCTACVRACPKQCISLEEDKEGFYYPSIDKMLCVQCGLCEKLCPFEHPRYGNMPRPKVYAAYLKDEEQRAQSTSGGIFYALARWTIEQNGIVYGAAFDEDFKLRHIGVDKIEGLDQLRGSKYIQSYLGEVFAEIKEFLELGRWVYFVGVGCQVAGLKAFLRKDYKNLLTSDLVCHGVPSQLMFDWHLDYLRCKEKGEITSYSFRDCAGWGGCETYTYVSPILGKRTRRLHSYILSPYLYSFMYAFNYRYSCYNCKFAKLPRQGDVTLADFWGVKEFFPKLDTSKGVSLILVNSIRGEYAWNQIKKSTDFMESCIDDASLRNANLKNHTTMPEIRKRCYELIQQRGYKSVAENEFRIPNYVFAKLYINFIHSRIGQFLRKIKSRIQK